MDQKLKCLLSMINFTNFNIMFDGKLYQLQYSNFGSILSIEAMIGAISSGWIADSIGRKGVRLEDTLSRSLIFGYLLLHKPFLTTWFLCRWNQAMRMSSMVCIAGWITVYLSFVGYVHFSIIILIYLCILLCIFNPLVVSI